MRLRRSVALPWRPGERSLLAWAALVVLCLAAACAPAPPAAPQSAPATAAAAVNSPPLSPPVTIRISTQGLAGEAGTFIALDKGYFAEEGLDVQLGPNLSGTDAIAALLSGGLDLAAIALDASSINAVSRNVDLRIVAPLTFIPPEDKNAAILVRTDLLDSGRYAAPSDLKGMVIGIGPTPRTSSQFFVEQALSLGGLAAENADLQALGFPDMLAALSTRKLDAAWEIEPLATAAEERGIAREVLWAGQLVPNYDPFLVVESPAFAKSQPEAVKRFAVAHLRGQRDYYSAFQQNLGGQAAKDAVIDSLTRHTFTKDAAVWQTLATKGRMQSIEPNDAFHLAGFDLLQDYFVRLGTLQQKIDIQQVIDPAPVAYALQRLGRSP